MAPPRRADDAPRPGHLRRGERGHQQVRRRHHGHRRQFRRAAKALPMAMNTGQYPDLPRFPGEGHDGDQHHARQVTDDHQALAVQAVGNDASNGRQDARNQLQDKDEAQQLGRIGHGEREQRERHQRHRLPQLRHHLRQPEAAEGGQRENVTQAAAGRCLERAVVSGGAGAGDRVGGNGRTLLTGAGPLAATWHDS